MALQANRFTGQPRSSQAIRLAQAHFMGINGHKPTTVDRSAHVILVATAIAVETTGQVILAN